MPETLCPDPIELASAGRVDGGVETYEALAHEYDNASHATTRELERLSAAGLRRSGLAETLPDTDGLVVELGAGTGALTKEYVGAHFRGEALLTDASPGMLSVARDVLRTVAPEADITFEVALASDTLARISNPAVILSGLGDPYLSENLLRQMVAAGNHQTSIFISTPSYSWALYERRVRLRIPITRTRFRTGSGTVHFSRSLAMDPEDLAAMAGRARILVRAVGVEYSEAWQGGNAPGVTWLLGHPAY